MFLNPSKTKAKYPKISILLDSRYEPEYIKLIKNIPLSPRYMDIIRGMIILRNNCISSDEGNMLRFFNSLGEEISFAEVTMLASGDLKEIDNV
jgi:hypothetical protein